MSEQLAGLLEGFGLLAFAGAVLADLRLLRKAYETQAEKVAKLEAKADACPMGSINYATHPRAQTEPPL